MHSHGCVSYVQAKDYDRHTYLPEKRAALEVWCAHLAAILRESEQPVAKVLPMRRAARRI